ncbi:MAG TPA: flagellar hook protein FlgE [Candidatus Methylomirabilis sp.]|nr:flagellar hook protein FlgE [Candidatus Methylomirabilis sp.]
MGSSMNSAVSGLRAHQLMLDVVGNNIANVNTPGFKAGRTTFSDVLSQTVAGATAPTATLGGTDPQQAGLGVRTGAITNLFTQGGILTTNKPTDLAIQGDGFFILSDGSANFYSRAGALEVDAVGNLVDSVTGYRVQGTSGDIVISQTATSPPVATGTATFTGNLDPTVTPASTYTATISINDSLGASHNLTVTFTKTATAGQFSYGIAVPASDTTMTIAASTTPNLQFSGSGALPVGTVGSLTLNFTNGASSGQVVALDFASAANVTPVTGFASPATLALGNQNGYASGTLQSFSIGTDGSINGTFSNGRVQSLGQIRLATFANAAGLSKVGNNLFRESSNSGVANVGNAGTGGRGTLAPGSLEGSNVDLADEFTKLIVAQRGFQANARVITTSDEVLQEAVNLKR